MEGRATHRASVERRPLIEQRQTRLRAKGKQIFTVHMSREVPAPSDPPTPPPDPVPDPVPDPDPKSD
jgi:hypothetical protein